MQNHVQEDFQSFNMPRKDMPDSDVIRYRVYSSPSNFIVVEAENAAEAMIAAGMGIPYKVMREMPLYHTLLSPKLIGLGVTSQEKAASVKAQAPNMPLTSLLAGEDQRAPAAAVPAAPAAPSAATAAAASAEVTDAVSEAATATLSQDEINKLLEG